MVDLSSKNLLSFITVLSLFLMMIQKSESEIDLTKEPGHLQKFGTGRPSHPVEEVVGFPNPEIFFKNYYIPQRPVKFRTGARLSPAYHMWTDEYFMNLDIPRNSKVHLETLKKESRKQETVEMNFKEFVKIYLNSSFYMVDSVPHFLRRDLVVPCCLQCPDIMDGKIVDIMMWFSSGGTNSVVHYDSVENINCLYRGSKDFVIVDSKFKDMVSIDRPEGSYSEIDVDSMDYVKYPGLASVEYIHAHLEAGDCLYIPFKWIHQVRSYKSNLAVNVWWDHYEGQSTDLSKCNKICDKHMMMDEVHAAGMDSLLESADNLRDHLADGLRSAKDKTLSYEEFIHILIPELEGNEGDDFIKEELDTLKERGNKLAQILDEDGDETITIKEVEDLTAEKLGNIKEALKAIEKIHNSIDLKYGIDDDLIDLNEDEEEPMDKDMVDKNKDNRDEL